MRPRRFRVVAIVCISLHLAACTHWRPTGLEPRPLIEEERPSRVLVIRTDGTEVVVRAPVIRSDSIVTGEPCERVFLPDGRSECASPPVAVALGDVRSVEVEGTDALATAGAVIIAPFVLVGLLLVACSADDSCFER